MHGEETLRKLYGIAPGATVCITYYMTTLRLRTISRTRRISQGQIYMNRRPLIYYIN